MPIPPLQPHLPPPQYPPVIGQLQKLPKAWAAWGQSLDHLHPSGGLSAGIRKASDTLLFHSRSYSTLCSKKGALELVPTSAGSGFFSKMFIVPSVSTVHHSCSSSWDVDVPHRPGGDMSRECCAKHRDLVLLLCQELGWLVNQEKSELISQQVFAFVGIHYNLIAFTANPILESWIQDIRVAQPVTQASPLLLSSGSPSSGTFRVNPVWSH